MVDWFKPDWAAGVAGAIMFWAGYFIGKYVQRKECDHA